MDKVDYKKEFKSLYKPKKGKFEIIEVPEMQYLKIHGEGNPNTSPTYGKSVEALFSIAYSIKFMCKKNNNDFVVMPLQGLWYADNYDVYKNLEKDKWKWTMMIMMPPFVTEDIFNEAVKTVLLKKENTKIKEVFLEEYCEGLVVHTLHIGSYNDEAPLIEKMHKFVVEQGYTLNGNHHEIYLSDPRKTAPEKLKTILRHPIVKNV